MVRRVLFWIVFVLAALIGSAAVVLGCGAERWAVKTSADKDMGKVDFTTVQSSIHELISLPAPTRQEMNAHSDTRFPAELKVYHVDAILVGFKLETDEDIHIVIASPNNPKETMIVEMPSDNCVPDPLKTITFSVRAMFEHTFGNATPRFQNVPGQVKIQVVGLGFFDFLHGQTGVAPNGFELHRVLNWQAEVRNKPKHHRKHV